MKLKKKKLRPTKIVQSVKPELDEEAEWANHFDFDRYEEDGKEDTPEMVSLKKDNKPRITGIKSRYSPHFLELERLMQIKVEISKRSYKIAGNSQEIPEIWEFYGLLNEFWITIKDMYGTMIIEEIESFKKKLVHRLVDLNRKGGVSGIDYSIHEQLLYFQEKLYLLAQRKNLGFEIDIRPGTSFGRAQNKIVEG